MNRRDRRAAASQERRAQDTMGKSYTVLSDVPDSVRNHPAFKEGQRRSESGEGLPPAYYEDIERAAREMIAWLQLRTEPPELRWLEWDKDRTFIAAGLDAGAAYLADSPDAFALLAWLDERTHRKLSLNQAGWALRLIGQLPMPEGAER